MVLCVTLLEMLANVAEVSDEKDGIHAAAEASSFFSIASNESIFPGLSLF